MTLVVLRSTSQVFCRMSFNWELSAVLLKIRWELCVSWRKTTEVDLCHLISRVNVSYHSCISVGHLVEVMWSGVSAAKLLFFPSVSYYNLWKEVGYYTTPSSS